MVEWLGRRTCNSEVLSSSPALTASWINCSWRSLVQILGHAKPVGIFNHVMFHLNHLFH